MRQDDALIWSVLDRAYGLPPEERESMVKAELADAPDLLQRTLEVMRNEHVTEVRNESLVTSLWDRLLERDSAPGEDLVGEVVDERYAILELVHHGGMGTVYKARHVELGHLVAIKVLRSTGERDAVVREGRRIAGLQHQYVVRVIDVGLTAEQPYLVMEWLEGFDLRDWLESVFDVGRGLPVTLESRLTTFFAAEDGSSEPSVLSTAAKESYWRFVATTLRDVAHAVSHAHELGIAHQDISPKNVVVTREGRVALVDFGLAALLSLSIGESVEPSPRGGTYPYMSPEHRVAKEERRLEKNDIYGLGATLLHLLLGISPDRVSSGQRRARRTLYFAHRRDRAFAVPRELLDIADKAMKPDPLQRYVSAHEFAQDLNAFLSFRPISVERPSLMRSAKRWWQRSPSQAALSVVAPVALLGLGLFGRDRVVRAEVRRIEQADARFAEVASELPPLVTLQTEISLPFEVAFVEPPEVSALLDELIGLRPDDHSLRLRRMVHASRTNRPGLVRADAEFLAENEPRSTGLSLLVAVLTSEEPEQRHRLPLPDEDWPEPACALDWVLRSYLAAAHREREHSIEAAERALELKPDDWLTDCARLLQIGFRPERPEPDSLARLRVERALDGRECLAVKHARAYWRLGLPDGDGWDEADALWREILERWPDNYHALHNMSYLAYLRGDLDEATELAERCARLRPALPKLATLRGLILRAEGEFEGSARMFEEVAATFHSLTGEESSELTASKCHDAFAQIRHDLYSANPVSSDDPRLKPMEHYFASLLKRRVANAQPDYDVKAGRLLGRAIADRLDANIVRQILNRYRLESARDGGAHELELDELCLLADLHFGGGILEAEEHARLVARCRSNPTMRRRLDLHTNTLDERFSEEKPQ